MPKGNIPIKIDYASLIPKKNIKKSKKIAFSALFSALGVVLMYLGSASGVLDISMACIASMLCIITVSEIGGAYPWLVFAVTGGLSVLILPEKFAAVLYVCFAGYYPMLKCVFERFRSRTLEWLSKLFTFNASLAVMLFAAVFLISAQGYTKPIVIGLVLLGNFTFVIYDTALSMLLRLYFLKYRKLLGIDKIFK
ncbi:MAG: hypothetical protein U0M06_07660 [Clostridia bacterium]|nr:hypothetical protein [Clostridia bacterium]